jgi:class 3 adenylate cyclase/rhodanese-related sulfurtransferase
MSLGRLTPTALAHRLREQAAPVLLDVRRGEAFKRDPTAIAGAIPLRLDVAPARIPDLPRDTPVVVYCLCSGQASSTRVALWLREAGYLDVSVLEGGLPAWQAAGLPVAPIGSQESVGKWLPAHSGGRALQGGLIAEEAFLAGVALPTRREMAVLFVDMVDSTRLLFSEPPERVLHLVQSFMEVVVDICVQHCGDVHDFEGDGAMLYFAGPGEAVPAAFNLRQALAMRRQDEPQLPRARFALDTGPLVVGYVGSRDRRSLSFIGPSINTAARILKLAQPGAIVATDSIVLHAARTDPDLAARFVALPEKQQLKGIESPVTVYEASADAHCASGPDCHA